MRSLQAWLASSVLMVSTATPLAAGAKAAVLVYPSGSAVPENLLRIELRFSEPLRAPLNINHVKFLNASGREIEDAFLDLPLPSTDSRRVTLLLHPGRVKSGVGANVLLGRALKEGDEVTLSIDDAALPRPVHKTWHVTAFDATSPAPQAWTFQVPAAGSRQALNVQLDAPISSSAESLIAIRGPNGARVRGRVSLGDAETMWRFTPDRSWQAGRHALMVNPDLEDPAGNRACAPFELVHASDIGCDASVERTFEVGTHRAR